MTIADALRFVQGAVGRKDFVPALMHYRIAGGFIQAFDGRISLCAPIPVELECNPRGETFGKAIQACEDSIELTLTPNNRLRVRSGSFKINIETLQEPYPEIYPQGDVTPVRPGFLDALRLLYPFTADDATKPWAAGILFRGESAYATNNIILVERWLGIPFGHEVNIPRYTIKELLRIGEEPYALQITDESVTFWFTGNRWLRSQLHSTDWPDMSPILSSPPPGARPIAPAMFDALRILKPFVDKLGRVWMRGGSVATIPDGEDGAVVEVPDAPTVGIYNVDQLLSLEPIAPIVDWNNYPGPCGFWSDTFTRDTRGAIIGMRP